MKNTSLITKIGVFSLCVAMPLSAIAQVTSSPTELVKKMQELLNQYSDRIQALEGENKMLREAMAQHNIQIPLADFQKNVAATGSTNVPSTNTANATNPGSTELQKGFINQIRLDWPAIREAYGMPANARIGMYEFVKNEAENNAFADIIYGDGTPEGAYNAKLLYEFDKITFKRKLIGFFEYDTNTKRYVTRRGNNPFPTAERIRVYESAVTNISPLAQTQTPETPQNNTSAPINNANANNSAAVEVEKKMRDAYLAKNFAQVFSISDEYLKNNPATYMIYFHRYRSYFAQGKYQQTMDVIKKMEAEKLADARIYCDAYAVAQIIKDTTLSARYKNLAGSGCKTTP